MHEPSTHKSWARARQAFSWTWTQSRYGGWRRRVAQLFFLVLASPASAWAAALVPFAWNAITMPASSGASCGNGSPYRFFVNPNPLSTKVIVMFEGGGACWQQDSCLGKTGILSAVNPDGLPTNYMSSLSTQSKLGLVSPMVSRIPLLGTTTPTQNWTMVYIGYCTGDVHVGNAVRVLTDADPANPRVQYFRGLANVQAAAEWLKQNLPRPTQLLVTGFSAGGVGSTAHYARVRTAMQPARSALLADSGPLFPAQVGGDPAQYPSLPLQTLIRSVWNLDGPQGIIPQSLAQYPGAFDPDNLGTIGPGLGRIFPQDRIAFALFQQDDDFSVFSYHDFYPGISSLPAADQFAPINALWRQDIANLTALLDTAPPNVGYYIPYGRQINHSHCLTVATFDGTGVAEDHIASVEALVDNLVSVPSDSFVPVMRVQQVTQKMPPETFVEWLLIQLGLS